ncbi:hypothetical protein ABIF69_008975 [Bradyrhizobium japonicum]
MSNDTFRIHLVSPQHEADDHAEREGRGERRDRAIRNEILKLFLLVTDGLAELGKRSLDLIGQSLGPVFELSNISSPAVLSRRVTSTFSARSSSLILSLLNMDLRTPLNGNNPRARRPGALDLRQGTARGPGLETGQTGRHMLA